MDRREFLMAGAVGAMGITTAIKGGKSTGGGAIDRRLDPVPYASLKDLVFNGPLASVHDHLGYPSEYASRTLDIVVDLFGKDTEFFLDMAASGPVANVNKLNGIFEGTTFPLGSQIAAKWEAIRPIAENCMNTGAGVLYRTLFLDLFGVDIWRTPLTGALLESLQPQYVSLMGDMRTNHYLLLKNRAKLSSVQIDAFSWNPKPAEYDAKFYRYDISLVQLVGGQLSAADIAAHTGIGVTNAAQMRQAIRRIFDIAKTSNGSIVAVKLLHAYIRTLAWKPVTDAAFQASLGSYQTSETQRAIYSDWMIGAICEAAAEYNYPVKIHCGRKIGVYTSMVKTPLENTNVALMHELVDAYPFTKFMLMHTGFPYVNEMLCMAKAAPGVLMDFSWAYATNPALGTQTLRHALNMLPVNKILAYGADTHHPFITYAHAPQARLCIYNALREFQGDTGYTESMMMSIAEKIMLKNAQANFGV